MFTVWQLLADFRAGKTISLVKSHATICFASYSAWQTRITRSPNDITLLWCRIQSFSEIENNKFVYSLQNWFVFVVAHILDYYPLGVLGHWSAKDPVSDSSHPLGGFHLESVDNKLLRICEWSVLSDISVCAHENMKTVHNVHMYREFENKIWGVT